MTIKQILQLSSADISAMSEGELRSIANALASAANKRIRRLTASGLDEYALSLAPRKNKSGKVKPFSTKLKKSLYPKSLKKNPQRAYDKTQMRRYEMKSKALEKARIRKYKTEIGSMRNFLTAPSSTAAGAMANKAEVKKDLGEVWDKLSKNQRNKFWDAYEKARAENPDLFQPDNAQYLKIREKLLEVMLLGGGEKPRLRNIKDAITMLTDYLETGYISSSPKPSSPFIKVTFEKQTIFK